MRIIDAFCGAGGAGKGYADAGFEVVGVDIELQPHYPFEFVQGDALEFIAAHADEFDTVHASPPCPLYSTLKTRITREHPDLVGATREALLRTGLPYVIENVVGAPLRAPIMLCGSMFGLGAGDRQLRRHRLFECSFPVMVGSCQHRGQPVGVYGTGGAGQMTRGYKGTTEEYREAMGMPWATRAEIAQAIPPAYTEHIGGFLMAELRGRVAA